MNLAPNLQALALPPHRLTPAIIAALAIWAAAVPPSAALHFAAGLVWLIIAKGQLQPGQRLLFLSPLFLLGTNALVFFSLLPALVRPWAEHAIYWIYAARAEAYHGLPAESLVIVFAMLCLLAHVMLGSALRGRLLRASPPFAGGTNSTALATIIVMAAACLIWLAALARWSSPLRDLASLALLRDLIDAAPTIAAFGLYFLAATLDTKTERHRLAPIAFFVGIIILGMIFKGEGKKIAFLVMGLGLFWLTRRNVPVRVMLKGGALMAVLAAITAGNTMGSIYNTPLFKGQNQLAYTAQVLFESKIWGRQLETALCLQGVIDQQQDQVARHHPFYFAAAVVPRYLWPDKPSLSKAQDFSVAYCGNPPEMVHSASITLLGEPLAEAGPWGLTVAVGVVLVGLGGLAWMGFTQGPAGLSLLAAMLPLLVDFDQSFSLYLANAVKFGLAAALVAGVAGHLHKKEVSAA